MFSIILPRMPLSEDKITSRYSITAYNPDDITVNGTTYNESLVLSSQSIHCPWPVLTVDDLDDFNLEPILKLKPRVVLLGTGKYQIFPDAKIYGLFGQKGIGLEVMNNGALCRTFNILVAEDREVVAAIIQS